MNPLRRYLRRMVVFLVAVAAAAAAVFPALERAFLVNPPLNALILGAVGFGIVYAIRQVLALSPEMRWAEATLSDHPAVESALPEPRLLAPLARMLAELRDPKRSALSAAATRSILDSLSDRLEEVRDITRYFVGLAIFLGLLGTFWGLLGTIATIGRVINGLTVSGTDITQVFADLKAGLAAPLAGMGTAFSSSLLGLSGSLVVGFLDLQLGQAQNVFFNRLEDRLAGMTRAASGPGAGDGDGSVPAYIGALLEQTAESLTEMQRVAAHGDENAMATAREIRELAQRLDRLSEHMETQQQVMLKLAENQSAMLSAVHDLARSETGLDADTRQALKALPRSLENGIAALLDDLSRGRSEISRDVRSEIKLLARTIAAVADDGDKGRKS